MKKIRILENNVTVNLPLLSLMSGHDRSQKICGHHIERDHPLSSDRDRGHALVFFSEIGTFAETVTGTVIGTVTVPKF